jgi:hypothetical protein
VPYIVTTKREPQDDGMGRSWFEHVSRRAVATLEAARTLASDEIIVALGNEAEGYRSLAYALPEAGGTVGPLPDGTVIEVEQVTWLDLARQAGVGEHVGSLVTDVERGFTYAGPRILDAYNARQA